MRKAFGIFILSVLLLAAALAGCNRQGGSAADDFPTLTPVPPTATPAPPTATPVPPTATPIPPTPAPVTPTTPAPTPKQTWRLDDPKTWDLKPYPEGKEPQPQNKVILGEDGGIPQAFYIGNPQVREYFVNLARETMFEQFGPGRGKAWIATDVGFDAFRKKWIIAGSPEEKSESKSRRHFLQLGVFVVNNPSPLDPNFAYFWEAWLLYDQEAKTYEVVTRWVEKPRKSIFYHLSDNSVDHVSQLVQPVEGFFLWRLDKDGKWRRWFSYRYWLNQHYQPKPAVYDPAP